MRVLGSSVLAFEAVAVLLGIPVAAVTGSLESTPLVVGGGLVLIALLVLAIAVLTPSLGSRLRLGPAGAGGGGRLRGAR